MHFVGPDQLHGFEERLTTDIYPADFGWTPDYRRPGERIDWWYHTLGSVTGAGVAEITNQLEYDDEVAHHAVAKLHDLSRRQDPRPWCLTVSFTHPHDPYVARQRFWDLYEGCAALDPSVPAVPFEAQDAHSRRLMLASDFTASEITPEDVRRARRAYFANISYIDEKIGAILGVLERERNGRGHDRGLRVRPRGHARGARALVQDELSRGRVAGAADDSGSRLPGGRCSAAVSTLDVLPTLADLVGIDLGSTPAIDGESLVGVARGDRLRGPVPMEYAAEGTLAPMVALRDGHHKLIVCASDMPLLYDLEADPHELDGNVRRDRDRLAALERLRAKVRERWDLDQFYRDVCESQARRHLVYEALRHGAYFPWDYQPLQRASERYMRNHMDLNVLEESQRYPRT